MRPPLAEVALVFLKLGVTGFGGPAAHIALMEEELVRRRRWLSPEHFAELLAAAQLMPGPNSTELAIHLGYARAGWAGLLAAGACFIAPAALLVTALAWTYVRWGALPAVASLLAGLQPAVVAVVAHAVWRLAGTALPTWTLRAIALAALAAALVGIDEILLLVLAGAAALLLRPREPGERAVAAGGRLAWAFALPGATAPAAAGAAGAFGLGALFLLFIKIGALLYGSGYVLVAFLRAELVAERGWLTEAQLLDAVAAGQVTPGPLFTTATFVGYLLGGGAGAAVATAGIFLPAFLFVAVSGPLVPRLRASPAARAFLSGVAAASLALMAAVTVALARTALVDAPALLLGAAALVLLVRFGVPAGWVLLGAAAAGLALGAMRPAPRRLARGSIRDQLSPVATCQVPQPARPPLPWYPPCPPQPSAHSSLPPVPPR
jgi:chromate transporter